MKRDVNDTIGDLLEVCEAIHMGSGKKTMEVNVASVEEICNEANRRLANKIYVVIVEDHHADNIVYPFIDPHRAIAEAKRMAHEYCRHKDDYKEHNYGKNCGWIFYADYSCEGDCVRVVTVKLDVTQEE